MEWKLPNAKNRDVERQHLNKILAEIRAAINSATTQRSTTGSTSTEVITRYAVADFLLTLDGDVTGSAEIDGTGDVTLTTTINTGNFLTDAPSDNQAYWRYNGTWQPVNESVLNLQDTDGLPEGVENLYFTDERAQDAVAAAIAAGTHDGIEIDYDDTANTLSFTVISSGGFVPTYIGPSEVFTVPTNRQALFAAPIDVQGLLVLDGILIEVN